MKGQGKEYSLVETQVPERQMGGDVKPLSIAAFADKDAEVCRWEIIKVVTGIAGPQPGPLDL